MRLLFRKNVGTRQNDTNGKTRPGRYRNIPLDSGADG